jgi:alpha-amylase/alpha-mannosidase (GH57 family)
LLALLAGACTPAAEPTTTPTTTPPTSGRPDPGFYLMLMWHQHQPFYPKDETGVYSRPWVRVHATKDYYDMAALVERYPAVKVTFNLTPVLLLQLEDLAGGAKDVYWTLSEIPADRLTEEQRQFITDRFFDVNPKIVERFPRYKELATDRDFTVDELRDLQVLFNLAWTDPDFLAVEPLGALVEKGRDFTEEDKAVLFAEHRRILSEVLALHARLWEEGRIEVTTTPLAHPILPLISDTSLASVGDPAALLPESRFQEIPDADRQVIRGLDVAERLLGRRPVGMWPGEGSVAQLVMSLFSKNGVHWVATGEDVLARSLEIGSFTRDARDTVEEGDLLYHPWAAQLRRNDPVAMFFRDVRLSDQIAFEYSGMSGTAAADDFMGRLRDIYESLDVQRAYEEGRPYVVSVILDGENAWEHYDNDGKDFLNALYRRLSESDWVRTITPSEYLSRFAAPEPLEEVFPASWFQPNFATWIGEEEEATAWDYLYRARQDLREAEGTSGYEEAFERMLFAEGSDWFWWYGSDQDSGNDGYFDQAFRELLGQVYDALGEARPAFIEVPIIPESPISAERVPEGLTTIELDGEFADWKTAGRYLISESDEVWWVFDRSNLYLRLVSGAEGPVLVYLGGPQGEKTAVTESGLSLGFGATTRVMVEGEPGRLELAVPLTQLGPLDPGDTILAKVELGGVLYPGAGPMGFQVPDISNVAVFLEVADPIGDDHGPGTYTYPTDGVFTAGSYDLERFSVGTEGDDLVFTFDVLAPIQNPWGSPRGLSVQTFDIYIDVDPGAGTGARLLIPGRNAALAEENGWEYAVTVEGWDPSLYIAAGDGSREETKPSFDVVTFGDEGKVVIRVPRSLFAADDHTAWGYGAAVMSQDGFPSSGVRRIRDVETAAQQWRLGGAPADVNHTRIIDLAWSGPGTQEEFLLGYASRDSIEGLGPEDFGVLPLLVAG